MREACGDGRMRERVLTIRQVLSIMICIRLFLFCSLFYYRDFVSVKFIDKQQQIADVWRGGGDNARRQRQRDIGDLARHDYRQCYRSTFISDFFFVFLFVRNVLLFRSTNEQMDDKHIVCILVQAISTSTVARRIVLSLLCNQVHHHVSFRFVSHFGFSRSKIDLRFDWFMALLMTSTTLHLM